MILLVDMNLSPRWVRFLQESGIAASHWSLVGSPTASDIEIADYARANIQTILTNDLDFSAILAATRGNKPSVVQIRSGNLNPDEIGAAVVAAIKQVEDELDRGALLSIEPGKSRLRLLPLVGR